MIKNNLGLPCSSRGSLLLVLMCGIMELPFVQVTASCCIIEEGFTISERPCGFAAAVNNKDKTIQQ